MRTLVFLTMVLFLIGACSSTQQNTSGKSSEKSTDQSDTGNSGTLLSAKGGTLTVPEDFRKKAFDTNGDKQPDLISYYKKIKNPQGEDEEVLVIKQMDLNHDGKIDVYRFYLDNGAIEKEELDLDFDGNIDAVDFYQNGVRFRREFGFGFNELPTIWKFYDEKGNNLVRLEEDQDKDGKVDYWEFYVNGQIERIEKDTDKDGKSDVYKRPGDLSFSVIVKAGQQFENDTMSGNGKGEKKEEVVTVPEEASDQEDTAPTENLKPEDADEGMPGDDM